MNVLWQGSLRGNPQKRSLALRLEIRSAGGVYARILQTSKISREGIGKIKRCGMVMVRKAKLHIPSGGFHDETAGIGPDFRL